MLNATTYLSSADWEKLLRSLHGYSSFLFNKVYKNDPNNRGKSAIDYVIDAIERHIAGTDSYDPLKSTLDYHLKWNIIRRAMFNDLPPSAKREYQNAREGVKLGSHLLPVKKDDLLLEDDANVPTVELLGLGLDHERMVKAIEKAVSGDHIMEQIYLAVCQDSFELSDRAEICHEFRMTLSDFDNGRRRFLNVAKTVIKDLEIISI